MAVDPANYHGKPCPRCGETQRRRKSGNLICRWRCFEKHQEATLNARRRERYRTDSEYREKRKQGNRNRLEIVVQQQRERYRTDPAYRERVLAQQRARLKLKKNNPEWVEHTRQRARESARRRRADPTYRKRINKRSAEWRRIKRRTNPEWAERERKRTRGNPREIARMKARYDRLKGEGRCVNCGELRISEALCWDCLSKLQDQAMLGGV